MNKFIALLYQSFLAHQNNTCLRIEDKKYSYKDVLLISSQIREQLKDTKNQNIGLYLTDDVYMYAAILAIWFEGKTYVPIHPEFPINKNLNIIEQAEICTIISSENFPTDYKVSAIDSTRNLVVENSIPKESSNATNAYILFTSGSTGDPKGVPIKFSNLEYFSKSFEETFGKVQTEDQVLQMFELTFDLSVMSYLIPWLNGATVVSLHKKETKFLQILDLLEANEITIALMVPSILNLIIPYLDPEIKNESLRLNLFCGEALLKKQIEGWQNFIPNANIYNVYGPTENTIFCTYYHVENPIKERNGIISIGKSMPYNNLSFVDKNIEGELLLSGKLLSEKYWKNETKTNEAFVKINDTLHYKTGDWCMKDDDGDFFYLNRIDFQAKINGFRIELSEVEFFANQKLHNAISVALINKDDADNDYLVLFVNDQNVDKNELISYLKQQLPEYSVPTKVIFIENYPVNTSGKIDRKELKNILK